MSKVDHIRRVLEHEYRLTETEWRELCGGPLGDLEEAVDRLGEIRAQDLRAPVRATPAGSGGPRQRDVRMTAISHAVAQWAEQQPRVMDFRRRILKGKLLAPGTVKPWIDRVRARDGKPTAPRLLAFVVPRQTRIRFQLVANEGALLSLLRSGDDLVSSYGWSLVDSVMFVLTGRAPVIPDLTVAHTRRPSVPVLNRVVLTIDPTLTPAEVAAEYQQARQAEFGHERFRNLSDKHTQLAQFGIEEEGLPWQTLRRRWNDQCRTGKKRKWSYEEVGPFRRDLSLAKQRLLRLDAVVRDDGVHLLYQ